MQSMNHGFNGRKSVNTLFPKYIPNQKQPELMTNASYRDITLVKQKEKIKYLKERIYLSNQLNLSEAENVNLYDKIILMKQLIVSHEKDINSLSKENDNLKMILIEKNDTIIKYEVLMKESREKLDQMTKINDILRELLEKTYDKTKGTNRRDTCSIKTNYLEQGTRANTIETNFKEYKHSQSMNKIAPINKERMNSELIAQTNDSDTKKLNEEMSKLKIQISDIENKFFKRLDEKDKMIEKLSKEKKDLIIEIDEIENNNDISSNGLYTPNEYENNEIISLRAILNDMNAKMDLNGNKFHSNINKLNSKDELKGKIFNSKSKQVNSGNYRHKRIITY